MTTKLRHPAACLAGLAFLSGLMGSYVEGPGIGEAPSPGLYLLLTGLWFGLVVAAGVWNWGAGTWRAAAFSLGATWLGWEMAVNTALQVDARWSNLHASPDWMGMFVGGFTAGALGALMTWAGAAVDTPALQNKNVAMGVVMTGAIFGLLLPYTNNYDTGIVLLLPWQVAVATVLGIGLSRSHVEDRQIAA